MPKISITIPAYEYHGHGTEILEYSFKQMEIQTFTDFDIIISDHSIDNELKNLCSKWDNKLNIKYIRNEKDRGNPSANANNAILHSESEYIKFLCQDDYLLDENSLSIINGALDNNYNWLVTRYYYTHDRNNLINSYMPSMNNQIMIVNTIGSPSCAIFKRFNFDDMPKFDLNLLYCWDCEFYYSYIQKYGNPKIIENSTVVNYLWEESITSSITQEVTNKENAYILKKHNFIKE